MPITEISTPEQVKAYIIDIAEQKGLPIKLVTDIANCESRFNKDSVGDNGTSFGVFQIHLPAHPDITKEQALDPKWSTEWSLNLMKQGGYKHWSCYRKVRVV